MACLGRTPPHRKRRNEKSWHVGMAEMSPCHRISLPFVSQVALHRLINLSFFFLFLSFRSVLPDLPRPSLPLPFLVEYRSLPCIGTEPCHLHGRWRRPRLARQLRHPVQVSSDDRREEMRRTPIMMIDAPCRRDGQIGPIMGHTRYLGRDLLNFPTFPPWLPTAT